MGPEKYGELKPVKVKHGKCHEFLGMVLYFGSTPGGVRVIKQEQVLALIKKIPENMEGKVLTPASNDLFQRGDGKLLSNQPKELFCTCVAKGISILKDSRPDTVLLFGVLYGRVRNPEKNEWRKLKSLVDYLQATLEKHIVLRIDNGKNLAKWHIDASFVVHDDFRSHTCGILTMPSKCGALNTASLKQKLNLHSYTEVELIMVDENFGKIL